jgi:transcriptional regulator with XRE-family HTH domain
MVPQYASMLDKESQKFIQNIGRRVAEIRRHKGWKQQDLADSLSLTWRQVARWEAGASNFTALTLRKLSKILGCSINDFFKEPKTTKPSAGRPRSKKSKTQSAK